MDSADQMTLSGAGLNAGALERLLQSDEPDWLKERRRSAWQAFERLPAPNWRYLDAGRFPLGEVVPFVEGDTAAALALAPDEIRAISEGARSAAGLVVQADNTVQVAHLRDDLREQGVILTDMATAVRQHGDLVRRYLFAHGPQPEEHRFLALHAALWTGGFFLYVPKNVEVDEPVYFLQALTRPGAAVLPHNLVVVDQGGSATVYEEQVSEPLGRQPFSGVYTEMHLEANAELQYFLVDRWAHDVTEVSRRHAFVGRDARFSGVTAFFGGGLLHADVCADLIGEGGTSEFLTLILTNQQQHLDIINYNRHVAPHTTGEMNTRQVLRDQSRTTYQGLIIIEQSAPHSQDYLQENALILDDGARADAIPSLEILNDEVAATHGATVGKVDETVLFYLMSRGLSRRTAELLLVEGFFAPLLERVPGDDTRERLMGLVSAKVAG